MRIIDADDLLKKLPERLMTCIHQSVNPKQLCMTCGSENDMIDTFHTLIAEAKTVDKVTEEMLRVQDGYIHLDNGCSIVATKECPKVELDSEKIRNLLKETYNRFNIGGNPPYNMLDKALTQAFDRGELTKEDGKCG